MEGTPWHDLTTRFTAAAVIENSCFIIISFLSHKVTGRSIWVVHWLYSFAHFFAVAFLCFCPPLKLSLTVWEIQEKMELKTAQMKSAEAINKTADDR